MKCVPLVMVVFLVMQAVGAVRAGEKPAAPASATTNGKPDGRVVIVPDAAFAAAPTGHIRSAAASYIESIEMDDVKLTDDQKQAMTEIIQARDQAMTEWHRENAEKLRAASNAMAEASKKQDREGFAKAQKEYQDLYVVMHEIMQRHQMKLQNVLTAEQHANQRDARISRLVKQSAGLVDLTEEQQRLLIARIKDTVAREAFPETAELYEVVQQVLTPAQKTAVARQRLLSLVKGMYARANLTEQQQKQAEAICAELAEEPDAQPVAVFESLKQRMDAVLTAEQKESLKVPAGGPRPPGPPPMPNAPAAGWPVPGPIPRLSEDPTIKELRSEVESLRREVKELRERVDTSTGAEAK